MDERGGHPPRHRRSGVPAGDVESRRVSVDPELADDEFDLLKRALEREKRGDLPSSGGPWIFLESGTNQFVMAVTVATVLVAVLLTDVSAFLLLSVLLLLAAGPVYYAHRRHVDEHRPERDPVEEFQGRFVTGDMLDDASRARLGRVQRAVDTVLDSSPHRRGLLLDRTRNLVVLADVEWESAQDLLRQTRTRQRIESMPRPGPRSIRAAERARAALAADVVEVDRRIRVLEDYADRVRAVELQEADRCNTAVWETIADSTVEAGAAHPLREEILSSLVQAQESALRLAALAAEDGSEDPSP